MRLVEKDRLRDNEKAFSSIRETAQILTTITATGDTQGAQAALPLLLAPTGLRIHSPLSLHRWFRRRGQQWWHQLHRALVLGRPWVHQTQVALGMEIMLLKWSWDSSVFTVYRSVERSKRRQIVGQIANRLHKYPALHKKILLYQKWFI